MRRFDSLLLLLSFLGAGCDAETTSDDDGPTAACSWFAEEVVSVTYGDGAGFGQESFPAIVLGPPKGGSASAGSLDVLTLGNGGAIVLGFGEAAIVDGPGPDFLVFENPFLVGGDPDQVFAELATVEVSADGVVWHAFPCATKTAPYDRCAGHTPVLASDAEAGRDPSAGGDAFDLAEVGLAEARFVRLTDRPDLAGFTGTFDLDAIAIVNGTCGGDAP